MQKIFTYALVAACLLLHFTAAAQNINIPDTNFKNALVFTACVDTNADGQGDVDADTNNDSQISIAEALAISELYVSDHLISSLEGIQYFTNLHKLYCYYNQLTSLNVQGLTNLQHLDCSSNQLPTLNLQGCANLQHLECGYNQLTYLNVQGLTNFQHLWCISNQLTALNLQGLTNLQYLDCSANRLATLNAQGLISLLTLYCFSNQLSTLNVQGLTSLQSLDCKYNQLSTLNVQGCSNLQDLKCHENQLTALNVQNCSSLQILSCKNNQLPTLNVQSCSNLQGLSCNDNQLTSLFIKNGHNDFVSFYNNPNLVYICCDNTELTDIQNTATANGNTNCVVDSACPLVSTQQTAQNDFDTKIQPNPTTDIISFTTTATLQRAEVYDGLGRLVQTTGIDNNAMSIGSLANGLYFVKLYAKEGVSMHKVVKE